MNPEDIRYSWTCTEADCTAGGVATDLVDAAERVTAHYWMFHPWLRPPLASIEEAHGA